jgi:hypothetical protein
MQLTARMRQQTINKVLAGKFERPAAVKATQIRSA